LVNNVELFSDAKASTAMSPRAREDRLKRAKERYDAETSSLEAMIAYADALFDNHRFAEAEDVLRMATTADDSNTDILYNLAFVYALNGKEDKARESYRRVVVLKPDTALAKSAEYELWKMGEQIDARWLRK
jgi:Flp pilus assembly protein TadD